MGLFSMFKKKQPEQSMPQNFDLNKIPTDLPSISGDNLNLPPLDDSGLPPIDMPDLPPMQETSFPSLDDINTPSEMPSQNEQLQQTFDSTAEDINNLFLVDPTWKEPDWKNFEPYHEEEEEPPRREDFIDVSKMKLPSLDEEEHIRSSMPVQEEPEEEFKSAEDFLGTKHRNTVPMELFVKDSDYRQVFTEMNAINNILSLQDSKSSELLELSKQQEPLMNSAKENLEFVQRKLMSIDRNLFS